MRFEYYRFLLTPLSQLELPFSENSPTREELPGAIFSPDKPYTFQYRGTAYGFVTRSVRNKKAFGRLGKQKNTTLHLSPASGFQEKQEEDWPGCHVFINLDDEKTTGQTEQFGQVIAIQVNRPAISSPTNCLRALADKINEEIYFLGYYLSINPILQNKKGFWSVVDEHEGKIKKVVLTYTPPNLFDLKNKLEDELRQANEKFHTTSTQIVLENNVNHLKLPKNDPLLKESADYIDQGAGNFKIHLKKGKKTIKSEAGVKVETFEGIELDIENNSTLALEEIVMKVIGGHNRD